MSNTIVYWHGICVEHFKNLCEALISRGQRYPLLGSSLPLGIANKKGHRTYEQQIPLSLVLDEYGRFNVWAGNIGAHQRGRVSLDHRLREASHIKDQVISLLQYLNEVLKDGKCCICFSFLLRCPNFRLYTALSIINGTRRPYEEASSSSESDSSDEDNCNGGAVAILDNSDTELQQLRQSIVKLVANLFKISIIIRKGNINQDRLLRSSKIDVSYYEPFDVQHAKNKFPSADNSLIERLGKAISRRRQYLKYREQHHEKLENPIQSSATSTRPDKDFQPLREDASKATSGARTDQKPTKPDPRTKVPVSHGSSTTASTFIMPNSKETINVDVDVYSESGTVSSYQPSLAGDEKLQLPPLPGESEDGRDFECPYCYTICKLTGTSNWARRREWKRHVFKDLQPYMCTFANCARADNMFERRTDWFRHETQLHRKEFSCNVQGHNSFEDKKGFIKHMEHEHGESTTQAQLLSVLALCERPLETTQSSCPLCHSEDAKDLTPKRLEKHLGRHMETLAMFALPRNYEKHDNKSVASDLAAGTSTSTTSSSSSHPSSKGAEAESVGYSYKESVDSIEAYLDYDAPFESIIRSFCAIEKSRDTMVPGYFAWQLQQSLMEEARNEHLEDQILIRKTAELLSRGTEDLKIADLVLLIYSISKSEDLTHLDSRELMRLNPKENLIFVIHCMIRVNSLSETRPNMTTRLEGLETDLRAVLKSEQDVMQNDISWDFVKPKIFVADSTITLLSRAIAALHLILSTSADDERLMSGWSGDSAYYITKACRILVTNLEKLVATTRGVEMDREIACLVEQEAWSQEQQVGTLLAISQKGERLSHSTSESSLLSLVDTFNKKVSGLFSLLGNYQLAGANDPHRNENLERTETYPSTGAETETTKSP